MGSQSTAEGVTARARTRDAPVMIEVRGLHKSFRIPEHRIDSLRERATHPFRRVEYREHRALRDVSFDVRRGEFFGIVGRNGSGKSSLLKILASIYRADAGTIRMAGRIAPFIELGVGFNADLSARENAILNGVLMGLTKREARRRLDAVIDFAELHDFVEVKLKNYSSGMMVRLAFAVMVQADADIMLIDEVLAVGDAAFGQKCNDFFHKRKREGKTVVLVTHDMSAVESLCHRAMLIHDGDLKFMGDPEQTALRYYKQNFGFITNDDDPDVPAAAPDVVAHVVHAHLENEDGERIENVEQGAPLILDATIEARRELAEPEFGLHVLNDEGVVVFGFKRTLDERQGEVVAAGQRVRLRGSIENRLIPGRYSLDCWVRRTNKGGDLAMQALRLLDFVVYGTSPRWGFMTPQVQVEPVLEPFAEK
jgi:ABC-type polysaccharide/polyol phosphate transport system ATPase subunit